MSTYEPTQRAGSVFSYKSPPKPTHARSPSQLSKALHEAANKLYLLNQNRNKGLVARLAALTFLWTSALVTIVAAGDQLRRIGAVDGRFLGFVIFVSVWSLVGVTMNIVFSIVDKTVPIRFDLLTVGWVCLTTLVHIMGLSVAPGNMLCSNFTSILPSDDQSPSPSRLCPSFTLILVFHYLSFAVSSAYLAITTSTFSSSSSSTHPTLPNDAEKQQQQYYHAKDSSLYQRMGTKLSTVSKSTWDRLKPKDNSKTQAEDPVMDISGPMGIIKSIIVTDDHPIQNKNQEPVPPMPTTTTRSRLESGGVDTLPRLHPIADSFVTKTQLVDPGFVPLPDSTIPSSSSSSSTHEEHPPSPPPKPNPSFLSSDPYAKPLRTSQPNGPLSAASAYSQQTEAGNGSTGDLTDPEAARQLESWYGWKRASDGTGLVPKA